MRLTEAEYLEFLARQSRTTDKRQASKADRDAMEAELLSHTLEKGRKNGWLMYHDYDSRTSTGAGFPDIVAVRPDVILFAELKRETEERRMNQIVWGELIQRATRIDYRVWRPSDRDEITRYLWSET